MSSRRVAAALLAALCLFAGVRASAAICGKPCMACCATDGDPTAVRAQMPCCRAATVGEPARLPATITPDARVVALVPATFAPPTPVSRLVAPSLRPTGALPHVALYRQHCALLL